jgi:hypothetical protein
MSEEELIAEARAMTPWQRHKFMVMVGLVIGFALILVIVSMVLYTIGGTAQLDLSRPGYQSVQKQVDNSPDQGFAPTGTLSSDSMKKFDSLYQRKLKAMREINPFSGDVLSDEALSISTQVKAEEQ